MRVLSLVTEHWSTIIQFGVTAWMAKVARDFQVMLAIRGKRMEATQEAVKRARDLFALSKDDEKWTPTINEMGDWLAVNEVHLTPRAARAFHAVYLSTTMRGTSASAFELRPYAEQANKAFVILQLELLRFRDGRIVHAYQLVRVWFRFRKISRPPWT